MGERLFVLNLDVDRLVLKHGVFQDLDIVDLFMHPGVYYFVSQDDETIFTSEADC